MNEAKEALQVTLRWGNALVDTRQFSGVGKLTIGTGAQDTFRLNVPGRKRSMVLARFGHGECEVLSPTGVKVALLHEGAEAAEVKVGPFRFTLRYVPVEALDPRKRDELDYAFLRALGSSVMVGAFVLAAIASTDLDELALTESLMPPSRRVITTVLKHPKKPEPKTAAAKPNGGVKPKGPEGVQGDRSDHVKIAAPTKGEGRLDGVKRARDEKLVRAAGLLGGLSGLGASTVFGAGGLNDGINSSLNNLQAGSGMGPSAGAGGMGVRGTGPGGGGHDLGIGMGDFGHGNNDGPPGGPTLGSGPKVDVRVVSDPKKFESSCERTSIARVMSRHSSEIIGCYETELGRSPELAGKVSVSFTIGGSGEVSEPTIAQSTLPDGAALEKCILSRLSRWKFPEPKGGGICVVNYPWNFHPAGSHN